jgi:hypothetical protein
MLYFDAVVYMLLALYLNQIVPQQYGVAKRWNYLWKPEPPVEAEKPA